jgi:hypothetical protein
MVQERGKKTQRKQRLRWFAKEGYVINMQSP